MANSNSDIRRCRYHRCYTISHISLGYTCTLFLSRCYSIFMNKKKEKLWSSHKADIEFSHWIRDRDGKRCFFCGKEGSQNSHFWGRRHSATRYDPLNCDYVCGGCHMYHEGSKQGVYRTKKIKQLGQEGYDLLMRRAMSTVRREQAIKICQSLIS